MSKNFIISTDSTADLPIEFIHEHSIVIHPLYYNINGEVWGGDSDMPAPEFYSLMRNGAVPTTMASNIDNIRETFESQIKDGFDVLHLGFSSGLSSSYNNAAVTARELCEKNPDSKIIVIDTLCASMGQGLLVYYAVKLREEGKTIDEIASWIEENKLHICHQFTVEDLVYLQRGGRVSKTAAVLGTLINVKPVLHVDNEGRLIPISKVRGRKKSLIALVENMEKHIGDYKNDIIFISHGDCLADAQFVSSLVKEKFGIDQFMFNHVSPTIGSHSGPGTVALFHLGTSR